MKLPKMKFPKVRFATVLKLVFFLVIILEAGLIYYSLYILPTKELPQQDEMMQSARDNNLKINPGIYNRAADWLKDREDYQLPDYSLVLPGRGRENPFAEP